MKIVGLTGGIGSGKSKVLNFFRDKGIPCYNSDKQAKLLVDTNPKLKRQIKKHFGDEIYKLDKLDSKTLSKRVFNNSDDLNLLNSIIHPAIADDFLKFRTTNKSALLVKEAAILFESGGYKLCDYTILITAPINIRIDRVVKRDLTDRDEVILKISNQWSDKRKSLLADKIIENIDWNETVLLLEKLLIELKFQFNIAD
ncbi:MAG: dephospho-CoA kinase [Flavobacteriaceae bacterium]|mgnify:CR=1 FL=1|nr:dephospho-CoA kinase [Flavobacteriaceae bacterium]